MYLQLVIIYAGVAYSSIRNVIRSNIDIIIRGT